MIKGLIVTDLKIIPNEKGNIFHSMKVSDPGYVGFGEAYFSTIIGGEIKAWKRHHEMTLNLTVPVGVVKFVLYDDRQDSETYQNFTELTLSTYNYKRLTIPPGIWMGFKGMSDGLNLLLNIANIEHDPKEQENVSQENSNIIYDWN